MKNQGALLQVIGLTALLSGCVSTSFEQIREAETGIEAGERVAIIGRQNQLGYEADASMVRCLSHQTSKISVVNDSTFSDWMFPWFEPRLAPANLEELKTLLKRPAFAARLAKTKVRYLVWVESVANTEDRKGSMSCSVGIGVGFCLGFMMWENDAAYEVFIWDLEALTQAGRMRSNASGSSAILGALVPIPLIAPVERQSCNLVAKNLSKFILEEGNN